MKIKLITFDETNEVISRYYISNAHSLKQISAILLGPLIFKKLALVDTSRCPKTKNYLRGMLDYNMSLISFFFKSIEIDCVIIPATKIPEVDYHMILRIGKSKPEIILSVTKSDSRGGISLYHGLLQDFAATSY